jgi:hypothetical protein
MVSELHNDTLFASGRTSAGDISKINIAVISFHIHDSKRTCFKKDGFIQISATQNITIIGPKRVPTEHRTARQICQGKSAEGWKFRLAGAWNGQML